MTLQGLLEEHQQKIQNLNRIVKRRILQEAYNELVEDELKYLQHE